MAAIASKEQHTLTLNEDALRELECGLRSAHHFSPRLSATGNTSLFDNPFLMQVDFIIPSQGSLASQLGIATKEANELGISAIIKYSLYRGGYGGYDVKQTATLTLLRDTNLVLGVINGITDHEDPTRSVRGKLVEAASDAYKAARQLMAAQLDSTNLITLNLPQTSIRAKFIRRCPGLNRLFVARNVFTL